MSEATIGERLLLLKERSGLSLAQIARAAGYRGASSIQKLFNPKYNPPKLPNSAAVMLTIALSGKGEPAIEASDIWSLVNSDTGGSGRLRVLEDVTFNLSENITISESKPAGPLGGLSNLDDVETFAISKRSAETYKTPTFARPALFWGCFLSTSSMYPRFEYGEPVICQIFPPPRAGDDVIFEVKDESAPSRYVAARLQSFDGQSFNFEQFNPRGSYTLDASRIANMMRVMRAVDLLERANDRSA